VIAAAKDDDEPDADGIGITSDIKKFDLRYSATSGIAKFDLRYSKVRPQV